jgi:hypothetical protein
LAPDEVIHRLVEQREWNRKRETLRKCRVRSYWTEVPVIMRAIR